MGLIQRSIEAAGFPTVSISILRDITEKVKPPRSLFLRWPFGHPVGEPDNIAQQFTILHHAFEFLYAASRGEIRELPYLWRRHVYTMPHQWTSSVEHAEA